MRVSWLNQFIQGLVGPHHEAHEAQDADEGVLGDGEGAHALWAVGADLLRGWDDEGQGAAAHGARQVGQGWLGNLQVKNKSCKQKAKEKN
jgi:hypothetical protein